jgi:iron(III) transport system ATP-binding protein
MKQHGCYLEIKNLSFKRNDLNVLENVNFKLDESNIGAIVGPSGSGKTTLLRLIAGFESPMTGEIFICGKQVSSDQAVCPPEKRHVGVVFQDFALFPHLNIEENIAFALSKKSPKERRDRLNLLIDILGLHDLRKRFPHEISGGQQQRVALGRALAPNPSLLLLDEPFSQLDPELREELIEVLLRVLRELNITTLLVTHHQEDAFDLSQKLGVLHNGQLLQWGDPFELYHKPKNRFVADFVGKGVFLPATVATMGFVETEIGQFPCPPEWKKGAKAELLVRPDDIIHVDGSPFKARLIQKRFRGSVHLYTLELVSKQRILALVPSHHNHSIGEEIGLRVDMDHINLYPISE